MKTRNLVLVLAALALVVGTTAVVAGPGRMGRAGRGRGMAGPPGMISHVLHRLDLSEEQRAQIRAILDEQRPATRELRDQLRANREAYRDAHPATQLEVDEAALRAHLAAQATIREEIAVAAAKTRAKVLAVLTAEQRSELEAMRAEMQDCAGARMGAGTGRFGGGPRW